MSGVRSKVIVYHDETKAAGAGKFRGQVLFFVPAETTVATESPLLGSWADTYSPKDLLVNKLLEIRCRNYLCNRKLHFADISGRRWTQQDQGTYEIIDCLIEALRSKGQRAFSRPVFGKLAILFYDALGRDSLYGGDSGPERELRHDETVLRMLLKGAAHYLYDENHRVEIRQIVADGTPSHRMINDHRVIGHIIHNASSGDSPLRDYADFADGAQVIHLDSDHKRHAAETENWEHAQLVQCADLLLGSVIRACLVTPHEKPSLPRIGDICPSKKDVMALPMRDVLAKLSRGRGFVNSGHYRAFTIGKVTFGDDRIRFCELGPSDFETLANYNLQFDL